MKKILMIFKSLRLHQWVKNLLVFVPLLAGAQYTDEGSDLLVVLAFILFGLTASSAYLINDLVDLDYDRQHDHKRHRPFASGKLNLFYGWLLPPVFLCVVIISALTFLPVDFLMVLMIYFFITLLYSFGLKKIVMLDVLILAALYTLRIIAGGVAVHIILSFWLLAFSLFLFLSLAFLKRYNELKNMDQSSVKKVPGRGYISGDLEMITHFGTTSGYLSVLILALYIQDGVSSVLYMSPKVIWLACPLLLYWISRVWIIAQRGQMHEDPIIFALKDPVSWVAGVGFIAVFVLAKMVLWNVFFL